jgi:CDP-paratose 2-epimerase
MFATLSGVAPGVDGFSPVFSDMKILITGIAGFVGSRLALGLKDRHPEWSIIGIDNLSRRGSETNLSALRARDIHFIHGDVRNREDIDELPPAEWLIDCAANPSVLAGVDGGSSQVVQHNLVGTLNLLEKCRRETCGFLMLSTSRVYSIDALAQIPIVVGVDRFDPCTRGRLPAGFSANGISEIFPTSAPISLYGATKLASEVMALEYGSAFGFPVWINRCGVLAGAGQFGKIDQGIFSFWIYQWLLRRPLSYIGFGGEGYQVRDLLGPDDLLNLLLMQIADPSRVKTRILNVGGGSVSSLSLRELSNYCEQRFGPKHIESSPETRSFDIPYYVTDNALASATWGWYPQRTAWDVLDEIAVWAEANRGFIGNGF